MKMKKENTLYLIILLAVALALIIIAGFALTNDTPSESHNVTKADIVTLDIADSTIQINIIGEKYKELTSYSVTTNLGDVIIDGKTEIKYTGKPQKIPFSKEMTKIKIIGHFSNGTEHEIFSGNIKPGIVAASINPDDVKVTVKFESNGGSYISPQTISLNKKTVKPADPKKIGYVFSGWYSDSDLTKPYAFGNFALMDTTLYAKWSKTHNVVFDSNGGVPKPKTQTVIDGEYAVEPKTNPVKAVDNFAGWFLDKSLSTEWVFDKNAVTKDITLYAKWAYENADYSVFGNDCAYKNQYDSLEKFVSSVNLWYLEKCGIDDFLVLKNNKVISVNGQNPLSLPLLTGREPVMLKSSASMTLALNSAKSFDVSGYSGSQIMIAGEGKIIIDGSLIFVVDRSSYSCGDELIEIEDGGELVLGSEAEVIVRVVNG